MSGGDLHSWKEIADYLGVTARCAQRWERERGMPVQRLPGRRGPVSASRAELEAWKAGAHRSPAQGAPAPVGRQAWRWPASGVCMGAAVCLFIIASYVLGYKVSSPGAPVTLRFDRHILIACDSRGSEVWRYEFAKPIEPTSYAAENPYGSRRAWFGDVDDDGSTEVLYAAAFEDHTSALLCFSSTGKVKWQFVPGATVASPLQSFPPPYAIGSLTVLRVRPTDPYSILLVGINDPDYATQVTLLSAHGQAVREYWHSGHIGTWFNVVAADRNKDGVAELYLGGVSNAYKQATLVVLDPRDFAGASVEERAEYQLRGFPPGRERARLLFPKGCIAAILNPVYNSVTRVTLLADGVLLVEVVERPFVGDAVEYRFGPDLRLQRVAVSDTFLREHARLYAEGLLSHAFAGEQEHAAFAQIRDVSRVAPLLSTIPFQKQRTATLP